MALAVIHLQEKDHQNTEHLHCYRLVGNSWNIIASSSIGNSRKGDLVRKKLGDPIYDCDFLSH